MSRFGDFLADKIASDDYFNKLFYQLVRMYSNKIIGGHSSTNLTQKEMNDVYQYVNLLINSSKTKARTLAYHIITLLEPFDKDSVKFKFYSSIVYYKLGLFALDINEHLLSDENSVEAKIKRKLNRIENTEYFLTDAQSKIYFEMINSNNFSFSGPTSLGKSFIISRMVERSILGSKNVALVVPSRALINQVTQELRINLKELITDHKYQILNNINGDEKRDDKYIFVLTPERLLNLHTRKTDLHIDNLFVDEAHKLASNNSDSERSLTEYNAIEMTLSKYKEINVYFSSPNISNPSVFLKLFGRNPFFSRHVEESPVSQHIFLIDVNKKSIRNFVRDEFFDVDSKILSDINSNDEFILRVGSGKHSNMIYCSRGEVSVDYAIKFMAKIGDVELSDNIKNAINSISELVHKDYYLVKCLYKRVAYHHGQLPHTVRGIIEELFRSGEINYMFCTPTLAEGVNMPTKNIFIICENKIRYTADKESNKIKSLNFWNLAGRAGRYRSELSGNVFCLNSDKKTWDNDLSIFKDKSVKLDSTIEKNIKNKSTVKKLELLLSGDVSADNSEAVIKHLSNIICIDTLRFPSDFIKSNTLRIFIESNLSEIVELASKRAKLIKDIPMELLNSFRSLDFNIHNDVMQIAKFHKLDATLPTFSYENCYRVLSVFHKIYKWEKHEDIKEPQIIYYNKLMHDWVSGKSINQIIVNSINYHKENSKKLFIRNGEEVITPVFDGSLEHINHIIENIFIDLEKVLRFKFERYFNHYHKALVAVNGEDDAKNNWATYLEYGSNNPINIELQTMGMSRFTAINILKNERTKQFIRRDSDTNKLTINSNGILNSLSKDSFEYKELSVIL